MRRQRPDGVQPGTGFKHAASRTSSSLSPMRQSQRVVCPNTGQAVSSGGNVVARPSRSNPRGSITSKPFGEQEPSPLEGFDYDAMGEACGRAQRLCDVMSFGCLALLNDSQTKQIQAGSSRPRNPLKGTDAAREPPKRPPFSLMKDRYSKGKENASKGRGVHGAGGLDRRPLHRDVETRSPPVFSRRVGRGGKGQPIKREVGMSPLLEERLEIIRRRRVDPWETIMDVVRWEGGKEGEEGGLTRAQVYGWDEEEGSAAWGDYEEEQGDNEGGWQEEEEGGDGLGVGFSLKSPGAASPPHRHVKKVAHSPQVEVSDLSSGSLSPLSLSLLSDSDLSSPSSLSSEEEEEDEEGEARRDDVLRRRVEATLGRYAAVDRYAAVGRREQGGVLAGEEGGAGREGRGRGGGASDHHEDEDRKDDYHEEEEEEALQRDRRSASMKVLERGVREVVEEELGTVEARLRALLRHWRRMGQQDGCATSTSTRLGPSRHPRPSPCPLPPSTPQQPQQHTPLIQQPQPPPPPPLLHAPPPSPAAAFSTVTRGPTALSPHAAAAGLLSSPLPQAALSPPATLPQEFTTAALDKGLSGKPPSSRKAPTSTRSRTRVLVPPSEPPPDHIAKVKAVRGAVKGRAGRRTLPDSRRTSRGPPDVLSDIEEGEESGGDGDGEGRRESYRTQASLDGEEEGGGGGCCTPAVNGPWEQGEGVQHDLPLRGPGSGSEDAVAEHAEQRRNPGFEGVMAEEVVLSPCRPLSPRGSGALALSLPCGEGARRGLPCFSRFHEEEGGEGEEEVGVAMPISAEGAGAGGVEEAWDQEEGVHDDLPLHEGLCEGGPDALCEGERMAEEIELSPRRPLSQRGSSASAVSPSVGQRERTPLRFFHHLHQEEARSEDSDGPAARGLFEPYAAALPSATQLDPTPIEAVAASSIRPSASAPEDGGADWGLEVGMHDDLPLHDAGEGEGMAEEIALSPHRPLSPRGSSASAVSPSAGQRERMPLPFFHHLHRDEARSEDSHGPAALPSATPVKPTPIEAVAAIRPSSASAQEDDGADWGLEAGVHDDLPLHDAKDGKDMAEEVAVSPHRPLSPRGNAVASPSSPTGHRTRTPLPFFDQLHQEEAGGIAGDPSDHAMREEGEASRIAIAPLSEGQAQEQSGLGGPAADGITDLGRSGTLSIAVAGAERSNVDMSCGDTARPDLHDQAGVTSSQEPSVEQDNGASIDADSPMVSQEAVAAETSPQPIQDASIEAMAEAGREGIRSVAHEAPLSGEGLQAGAGHALLDRAVEGPSSPLPPPSDKVDEVRASTPVEGATQGMASSVGEAPSLALQQQQQPQEAPAVAAQGSASASASTSASTSASATASTTATATASTIAAVGEEMALEELPFVIALRGFFDNLSPRGGRSPMASFAAALGFGPTHDDTGAVGSGEEGKVEPAVEPIDGARRDDRNEGAWEEEERGGEEGWSGSEEGEARRPRRLTIDEVPEFDEQGWPSAGPTTAEEEEEEEDRVGFEVWDDAKIVPTTVDVELDESLSRDKPGLRPQVLLLLSAHGQGQGAWDSEVGEDAAEGQDVQVPMGERGNVGGSGGSTDDGRTTVGVEPPAMSAGEDREDDGGGVTRPVARFHSSPPESGMPVMVAPTPQEPADDAGRQAKAILPPDSDNEITGDGRGPLRLYYSSEIEEPLRRPAVLSTDGQSTPRLMSNFAVRPIEREPRVQLDWLEHAHSPLTPSPPAARASPVAAGDVGLLSEMEPPRQEEAMAIHTAIQAQAPLITAQPFLSDDRAGIAGLPLASPGEIVRSPRSMSALRPPPIQTTRFADGLQAPSFPPSLQVTPTHLSPPSVEASRSGAEVVAQLMLQRGGRVEEENSEQAHGPEDINGRSRAQSQKEDMVGENQVVPDFMMTKAFSNGEEAEEDEDTLEGAGVEGTGAAVDPSHGWRTAADSLASGHADADGEAGLSTSRSGEGRLGGAESVFFSAGSGRRGFIRQETFAYVVDSCSLEISEEDVRSVGQRLADADGFIAYTTFVDWYCSLLGSGSPTDRHRSGEKKTERSFSPFLGATSRRQSSEADVQGVEGMMGGGQLSPPRNDALCRRGGERGGMRRQVTWENEAPLCASDADWLEAKSTTSGGEGEENHVLRRAEEAWRQYDPQDTGVVATGSLGGLLADLGLTLSEEEVGRVLSSLVGDDGAVGIRRAELMNWYLAWLFDEAEQMWQTAQS